MAIAGLTGASWTRFANEKRPGKGERPREPAPDDGTGTGTIDRIPEPTESMLEALWHQEWETALLDAALERVKRHVSPEQFQIFDLYALKELPVAQVASILGVNGPRIYLAKHRIAALLKKEIEKLKTQFI